MKARIPIDKPIVLVGLMGVGKSTVGKRLANALSLPFVDADDEIERAANLSVSEIFEQFGEDYFRDGERRVIERLLDGRPKVLAAGGGAFASEATRSVILDNAVSVWLDADIDILAERVARRDTRPLVRGKDPRQVLSALARERNPAYAQADIHIKSGDGPHAETVKMIVEALGR